MQDFLLFYCLVGQKVLFSDFSIIFDIGTKIITIAILKSSNHYQLNNYIMSDQEEYFRKNNSMAINDSLRCWEIASGS